VQGFAGEIVGGAETLAGGKEALANQLLLGGEAVKLRLAADIRVVRVAGSG